MYYITINFSKKLTRKNSPYTKRFSKTRRLEPIDGNTLLPCFVLELKAPHCNRIVCRRCTTGQRKAMATKLKIYWVLN